MKYLDPKTDLTFKRVFGEHKDLLISLLNSLLPLPLNYSIEEVEYLTPEIVPDLVSKKNSIVDVRCMEKSGREFIVEMQMYWTKDFLSRALFNTGKAYTIQAGAGFNYKDLKSVYTLCLINDMAFSEYSDDFYFDFVVADRQHPQLVIEGMEIVMVELPKYIELKKKGAVRLPSVTDNKRTALWMSYLTEINDKTQNVPDVMLDDQLLSKALRIVECAGYTDAQMMAYEKFWDAVRCELTIVGQYQEGLVKGREEGLVKGREEGLVKGREEGLVKGREEGKKEGLEEGTLRSAKKLLEAGMTIEDVVNILELTTEQVDILTKS